MFRTFKYFSKSKAFGTSLGCFLFASLLVVIPSANPAFGGEFLFESPSVMSSPENIVAVSGDEQATISWDAVEKQRWNDGNPETGLSIFGRDVSWTRSVDNSDEEYLHSVIVDDDGSIVIVGETNGSLEGSNAGAFDAYVAKYSGNGAEIWIDQFGANQNDGAYGIAIGPNGDYFVAGKTSGDIAGSAGGGTDAIIRKYGKDGSIGWTIQFGTTTDDEAIDIAVASDGNIYVVGHTGGFLGNCCHAGGQDIFVQKYDAQAQLVWTRDIRTNLGDIAESIAVDSSGVVVAGRTNGDIAGSNGSQDGFIRKYDVDGNTLWTDQFGSAQHEELLDVDIDSNGNIYAVGRVPSSSGDAYIRKYDPSGSLQWVDEFGTLGGDSATSIVIDDNDSIFVTGYVEGLLGETHVNTDGFLRRYGSDGTVIVTEQFHIEEPTSPQAIAVGFDGSLVIAGTTGYCCEPDIFIQKHGSDGAHSRSLLFGEVNEHGGAFAATISNDDSLYVAGYQGDKAYLSKMDSHDLTEEWKILTDSSVLERYLGADSFPDGSVVVVGTWDADPNTGERDVLVRKYGADGTMLWEDIFGSHGGNSDRGTSVAVGTDGSVYVAGFVGYVFSGVHAGMNDAVMRKYSSSGSIIWTEQFGSNRHDEILGIDVSDDGSIYVAGYTGGGLQGGNIGADDAFLRKYDASGSSYEWTKQFGTGWYDRATEVVVAPDGYIYVAGHIDSPPSQGGDQQAFLRKYDSSGNEIWIREFGSGFEDVVDGLTIASDNTIYVTGTAATFFPAIGANPGCIGSGDGFIRRYTSSGEPLWDQQFCSKYGNQTKLDAPTGIAVASDGTLIVAGWTEGNLDGNRTGYQDSFIRQYEKPAVQYVVESDPEDKKCRTTTTSCSIDELTNGSQYTFTVSVERVGGFQSLKSAPSSQITPYGKPDPPQNPSAVPGNELVTVSWDPPVSDNGSVIASYTATADPGGETCNTSTTTCVITNLTNDTTYAISVIATNLKGDSDPSSPVSVTPFLPTVPDPPTNLGAYRGDGYASVTWDAPTYTGTSSIVSYTVTSDPEALTCTSATTTCVVSGLTNGTTYTFTATATNSAGEGPSSGASNPTIPNAIEPAWIDQFGSDPAGTDYIHGTAIANDGSIYVIGDTYANIEGTNAGQIDVFIRKYNAAGTHQWTDQIGTFGTEEVRAVVVAEDGSIYFAGQTQAFMGGSPDGGGGDQDGFLAKYQPDGTQNWVIELGSSYVEYGEALAILPNGNILVGGATHGNMEGQNNGNSYDVFIQEYQPDGTYVWTDQFGSAEDDWAEAIVVSEDGDFYISGYTYGDIEAEGNAPNIGGGDGFIRKYDSSRSVEWTERFGSSSNEVLRSMAISPNGEIAVVGRTEGTIGQNFGGEWDGFIRVYDSSGNHIWTDQFVEPYGESLHGVDSGVDGSFYVSGGTLNELDGEFHFTPGSMFDAFVRKYGNDGTVEWTNIFGTLAHDDIRGMSIRHNGDLVVAGHTNGLLSNGSSGITSDGFVRKYAIPRPSPTNIVLTGGNAEITVAWDEPTINPNESIDSYTVTSNPESLTCTTANTSCTVTGLTNGTTYTFSITATYDDGVVSDPIQSTSAAFPAGPPTPPTNVSATGGNTQATVTWDTPSSDGGATITGYTVTSSPGNLTCSTSLNQCTITGLTNGTNYTFTVIATNAEGSSTSSDASNTVTPITVPDPPTNAEATRGDGFVTVSWEAPADNGGASISGYVATANPSGLTCTTTVTSCTVGGLTNAIAYTFTVTASNAAGTSNESNTSNTAVPGETILHWSEQFGTNATDEGRDIVTSGDDTYVFGSTMSDFGGSAGDSDGFVRKYDGSRAEEWTVHIGSNAHDNALSGAVGDDGSIYVTGSTQGALEGSNAGSDDAYLRKLASDGTVEWTNQFGSNQQDIAHSVAIAPDGHIYVAGSTTGDLDGVNTGGEDGFLTKFQDDGTQVWTVQFGDGTNQSLRGVTVSDDGTIYVTGWDDGNGLLQKFDDQGTTIWSQQIASTTTVNTPEDRGYDVVSSPDNAFVYVAGATQGVFEGNNGGWNNGDWDGFLAKYQSDGTVIWVRQTQSSPTANDELHSVEIGLDGNIFVAGYTMGSISGTTAGQWDGIIQKYGTDGSILWEEQIGTTGAEYIWGINVSSEGSLHVTGRTEGALDGGNSGSNDVFVRIYAAAPPSPTSVTVTPASEEITVSWTAPETEPNDTITSYTVTGSPNGTCTTANTTCTITGLTNGTNYTFTVTANYDSGLSSHPTDPKTSTPTNTPSPPTNLQVTLQGTEAQLSWDAPGDDGGSPITSYTVTSDPEALACSSNTTNCSIYGLTVGVTYTFTVVATNPAGNSAPSDPTQAVTVSTAPPGVPINLSISSQQADEFTLTWDAPAETGGSAITNYKVEYRVTDSLTGSWLTSTSTAQNTMNLEPTIVNGSVVPIENHPYQVQIQYSLDSGLIWYGGCGGSLVDSQWVVTAAHCLDIEIDGNCVPIGSLVTGLRISYGTSSVVTNPNTVSVDNTYLYPNYDCTNFFTNDIALMHLSQPVDMEKAGTLPLYDFTSQPSDGTPLFATGWGDTFSGSGSGSDLLLGKQLNVDADCSARTYINDGITLCAGDNINGNTCQGDSGGPLVGNFNNVLYLTGIVSGGIDCGQTGYSSLFTRVSYYVDWIQSYTGDLWSEENTGTQTNATLSNLEPGEYYAIRLSAENSNGSGENLTLSNVVNYGPPTPPRNVVAQEGDEQVSLYWDTPVKSGGAAITSYTATASPGGQTCTSNSSPFNECTVQNLINGVAYTFTVIAENAYGESSPSEPSNTVTPIKAISAPEAPQDFVLTSDGSLMWSIDNGNAPITNYTIHYKEIDNFSTSWVSDSSSASDSSISPFIVNGNNRNIQDHPYQVHLEVEYWWGGVYTCGGTIIAETWVLTAAHCLEAERYGYDYGPDYIKVTFNSTTAPSSSPSRYKWASAYAQHGSYDNNYYENDIGLVELSSSFDLSEVAALPLYDFDSLSHGSSAYVTGWGRTSTYGSTSSSLLGTSVSIDTGCGAWSFVPSTQICAWNGGASGVCNGDSGGPLVTKVNDVVYLTGVVSYGSGYGCATSNFPDVYTRVSSYKNWIEGYTGPLWSQISSSNPNNIRINNFNEENSYLIEIQAANSEGNSPEVRAFLDPIQTELSQSTPSVKGGAETNDYFGSAVTTGDYDGDGKQDVIVGIPGEGIKSRGTNRTGAGLIQLFYGLDLWGRDNHYHQNTTGFPGGVESDDRFGSALATGDFNADGYDDVAIGVPGEDIGSRRDAGHVTIAYGNSNGLGSPYGVDQGKSAVKGTAEAGDLFGAAVTTGDINGDGYDDLVVGAPGEGIGKKNDAGLIHVFYGSESGITTSGNQAFSQNTAGVNGVSEAGDLFGQAVAIGDVNGDGFGDVVIGAPGEGIGKRNNAGAIHVLYGSENGLTSAGDKSYHQNSPGVPGGAEAGDRFGQSLALGDINSDGIDDILLGAPGEGIGSKNNAGMVHIIYSDGSQQAFSQNTSGVKGVSEKDDRFGETVAIANVTAGNGLDIIIGAPGEAIGSRKNAGLVAILPDNGYGKISTGADSSIYIGSSGLSGTKRSEAQFGASLAIMNSGILAGAPGAKVSNRSKAGNLHYFTP